MSDPRVVEVWGVERSGVVCFEAPLSKSFFYRLAALLFTGRGCVKGIPDAEDADSVVDIIVAGGGSLVSDDRLCVDYFREAERYEVDVGCSGGALRVTLPALLAAAPPGAVIVVKACRRLFERLEDATLRLFAYFGSFEVRSVDGLIVLRKERMPEEITLAASESSQPISGALIAAAVVSSLLGTAVRVSLSASVSAGHVYQTIEAMKWARVVVDASVASRGGAVSVVGWVEARQRRLVLETPGDWGLAALAATAFAPQTPVVVEGLWAPWGGPGDHMVALYARLLGYESVVYTDGKHATWLVEPGEPPLLAELNSSAEPDVALALAYMAAAAGGGVRVRGVGHLSRKESNRLETIAESLRALGYASYNTVDSLVVAPGRRLAFMHAAIVCPGDHRVAMGAAAVAAAQGVRVRIERAACVAKSWRGFWERISRLGVRLIAVS